MTGTAFCSIFLLGFLVAVTSSFLHSSNFFIQYPEVPYYSVVDFDNVDPSLLIPPFDDNQIKSIQIQISFHGAITPGVVSYQFYKCGEMIFNSTSPTGHEFTLTFRDEWIALFLNGTAEKCSEQERRELVIIATSSVAVHAGFTFGEDVLATLQQPMGYLTEIRVQFDGKIRKIHTPLEGVLKLQEEFKEYFPVHIGSDTGLSLEIGVCNSTFLRIEEEDGFHREFTVKERRILSLMRNVHCGSWREDLQKSNFFIRSLSGVGILKIGAIFEKTSNLLDNDDALEMISI